MKIGLFLNQSSFDKYVSDGRDYIFSIIQNVRFYIKKFLTILIGIKNDMN